MIATRIKMFGDSHLMLVFEDGVYTVCTYYGWTLYDKQGDVIGGSKAGQPYLPVEYSNRIKNYMDNHRHQLGSIRE